MTLYEQIITIVLLVLATVITRFLPFIAFSSNRPTPDYIKYLGTALPPAVFGILVIYSLKDVSIFSATHAIPEAIAIAVTLVLHYIKRQMLLSIAGGTICYMILIHLF